MGVIAMVDLINRFDFWFSLACAGLVLYLWGRRRWRRFLMSREERVRSVPLRSVETYFAAPEMAKPKPPKPEIIWSVEETERDKIEFAELAVAEALARLILAGELDKTKAIKIGAGKKSGEGYQKWARLVGAAIDRQKQPEFPTLEATRRPSVVERP